MENTLSAWSLAGHVLVCRASGGIVTITTVGPTLVAAPPYLWGNNSGLIMTGGIVGAILGLIVTNISADRVMVNKGA